MSRKRILVAEDEPDILRLMVYSLEYAGFEVMEAINGEDAVKMAAEGKPDLILLDVRMPRMSGYAVCTALKEQESTKHIPIIFVSARGQEAEIKRGLELGAEEYILKPFAPDELYQRVERRLQRMAATRAGEASGTGMRRGRKQIGSGSPNTATAGSGKDDERNPGG